MMNEPVDFFVHIPKTAGTTMLRIIEKQYRPGTVASLYDLAAEECPARLANLAPEMRVVAAHLDFGHTKHVPRPCRPFALLRDPLERLISNYYFIAREPGAPAHRAFLEGKVTLQNLAHQHRAVQTCFIAGLQRDTVPDDVLLAQAKENLARHFIAFGLTERFDESLLLFNQALGWEVRGYARANVTHNRPAQQAITPADLEIIRSASALDLALYEFARELFAVRIAAQLPQFARELAALRRNVKMAQRVSRLREGLRSVGERIGIFKKPGTGLL